MAAEQDDRRDCNCQGVFKELLEYVGLNEGSLLRELHSISQREGEKLQCYHTRFANIVNVLQRLFDSEALTHSLKFELFQRGVHPHYKQYLWTANSNIESWLDQAKKLERFANDVRLNAPAPPPNEPPNANYMQMFSSVEPMFAGFAQTSTSVSQKLDSLINRLDERGFLDADPAEKRPFSENIPKDSRPNKRANNTGFIYAKKPPAHVNNEAKKSAGESTRFSPSSFAKSTIKKMRITAPAYFVLKGILDEIDSSSWARVEKVFQRESQVSAIDVDSSIIVEDEEDAENEWNDDCNIVETKLTPSEVPLEFYPNLQEIMVTEPSDSVKNGEVNFDQGKTFSSCCFKKVQISNPRGTSPRNNILKNTRKVLLDSGAATSLISVDLVEKLRMRESINTAERGCFINANGKSFHTLGKVNIPLSIFPTLEANKPIPFGRTSFHVLDRRDSKIILGMDWLYKNKVTLDTSSQRVSVISPYGLVRHLDISYVVKGSYAFNALEDQGISWTGNYWKLYNSKKEGMYDIRYMQSLLLDKERQLEAALVEERSYKDRIKAEHDTAIVELTHTLRDLVNVPRPGSPGASPLDHHQICEISNSIQSLIQAGGNNQDGSKSLGPSANEGQQPITRRYSMHSPVMRSASVPVKPSNGVQETTSSHLPKQLYSSVPDTQMAEDSQLQKARMRRLTTDSRRGSLTSPLS